MTLSLFLLAFAYLLVLFWLGRWGDKNSFRARKITSHPAIYSLALAIYCTAWTFYGAVGEAARNQWHFLPILLGPILVYVFGRPFLYKLVRVSKKQNITTIADFIASRYGKRQTVALLVTLIALLATIPYIALQLKAIGLAFSLISGTENAQYVIILATVFIGVFCIYFGTQRTDVTEYRRGLMLAIAFESLFKLFALVLVAVLAYSFWRAQPDVQQQASNVLVQQFFTGESLSVLWSVEFWAQTLVAAAAVICLPRQFHVAIVDNLNVSHLNTARWLFPWYLTLIALLIPFIAAFGGAVLGQVEAGQAAIAQSGVSPDTYVIHLAVESGSALVTGIVFLGGLSAGTAMIIVATLTLSTMVTNDVILPRILIASRHQTRPGIYTQKILWLRRVVIAGLLILAALYHQQLSAGTPLTHIGLLAFSLVIHLLPAIVGGLYWKKANAQGVYAGWFAGLMVWVWWLFLPLLDGGAGHQQQSGVISLAAVISLLANVAAYVVFSWLSPPRLADKIQAQVFVDSEEQRSHRAIEQSTPTPENVTNDDLITVLNTFLGVERSQQLLQDFEHKQGNALEGFSPPSREFIQFCERALGGVIGAASAHLLINSVVSGEQLNFEQVIQVFDETARAIKINQSALFASLESLEQGISVIDRELTLVAWNQKYLNMFDYPEGFVSFGTPIEDLVRYNAVRGECGVGDIEMLVQKRVEHLRSGKPHKFIRQRSDGRVIEMVGNPLPSGGFVTSFNDITEHMELQTALQESNIDLKNRIQSRTQEVQKINSELRLEIERRSKVEQELNTARKVAEAANLSKTRFLALASHDVLQPLNAAKLYLSALKEMSLDEETARIFEKIDDSVSASEAMISTLLDISRIEQGDMQPTFMPVSLNNILPALADEFELVANKKGLKLKREQPETWANIWVNTDSGYLQRIIRNLLSNAVKYTNIGTVTLAVEQIDPAKDNPAKDNPAKNNQETANPQNMGQVAIKVIDTGVGIPPDEQLKVFSDFYRVQNSQADGVGLGLGVVTRLSEQISASVQIESTLWQGSCFSVTVAAAQAQETHTVNPESRFTKGFKNMHVLCIDDEQANLNAMKTLLIKWQLSVDCVLSADAAFQACKRRLPNVMLVDYQLGHFAANQSSQDTQVTQASQANQAENGIDLIKQLRNEFNPELPAVLITANRDDTVIKQAAEQQIHYFTKPLKPARLRAFLRSIKN